MIKGAPVGTVDFANLSGWINSELFLEWDYNNNYVCNLSIKINLYFTFLLSNDGCVHCTPASCPGNPVLGHVGHILHQFQKLTIKNVGKLIFTVLPL